MRAVQLGMQQFNTIAVTALQSAGHLALLYSVQMRDCASLTEEIRTSLAAIQMLTSKLSPSLDLLRNNASTHSLYESLLRTVMQTFQSRQRLSYSPASVSYCLLW
eukprot:scpid26024/ scgid2587/ 